MKIMFRVFCLIGIVYTSVGIYLGKDLYVYDVILVSMYCGFETIFSKLEDIQYTMRVIRHTMRVNRVVSNLEDIRHTMRVDRIVSRRD